MQIPPILHERVLGNYTLMQVLIASAAAAALGLIAYFLLRKRKSDAEIERERRMAVNIRGRMTAGVLTIGQDIDDAGESPLIFYRYSVAGVEYSAAQDVSSLRSVVAATPAHPGCAVMVKYDHQKPTNSIVVCEAWSGLNQTSDYIPSMRHQKPVAAH
jgi:hypothetical protein